MLLKLFGKGHRFIDFLNPHIYPSLIWCLIHLSPIMWFCLFWSFLFKNFLFCKKVPLLFLLQLLLLILPYNFINFVLILFNLKHLHLFLFNLLILYMWDVSFVFLFPHVKEKTVFFFSLFLFDIPLLFNKQLFTFKLIHFFNKFTSLLCFIYSLICFIFFFL